MPDKQETTIQYYGKTSDVKGFAQGLIDNEIRSYELGFITAEQRDVEIKSIKDIFGVKDAG